VNSQNTLFAPTKQRTQNTHQVKILDSWMLKVHTITHACTKSVHNPM